MIVSSLASINEHPEMNMGLRQCIVRILSFDLIHLAPGSYPIEGDMLSFKIMDRQLAAPEDKQFEVHRQYIDIHIPLNTNEAIGYNLQNPNMALSSPFDNQNDIGFSDSEQNSSWLILSPGDMAIIFPQEWHKPACTLLSSQLLRKVVAKVHRSYLLK